MLDQIEQWIDQTNSAFLARRVCCDRFSKVFEGFYSVSFLNNAFFVVVDKIPKPAFPELREMGLDDFIDMDITGITYKNTYYILPHVINNIRLHFHELVHVAQWKKLGTRGFIERYIREIQNYGYDKAPLETVAYFLDNHFVNIGKKFDIPSFISEKI
ncbi:hypothetical protein EDC39_10558 [Geothermobacter ehrlichii]|uniref:DUF4157 domain-containing protein n=1 Tax=Geothermobacter ehrlichii TaxID=213224 RepID=A0A5D3WMC7_9BACT|nr:hypothetical protein [Geothermobacter ehrlichii]TYO98696.1 hypothetical protein EDC39_10558 [Geothermobacter ehrlichii]